MPDDEKSSVDEEAVDLKKYHIPEGADPMYTLTHLPNHTEKWWFRDPGMRRLSLGIFVGFCTSIIAGYDSALMSGLLANDRFMDDLGNPSPSILGTLVASQSIGSLPGLLPAVYVSDKLGRRKGMAFGYIILMGGAMTLAFTQGPWTFFAGRFVIGMGLGWNTVCGGPYTAEIAHPRNRAVTTALIMSCFYVGSIAAVWVVFGCLQIVGDSDWAWRAPLASQCCLPIIVLACLPWIPESPRWLIRHGHDREAHDMLAKYHANGDWHDPLVVYEMEDIKTAIAIEHLGDHTTWSTFVKTKGNRWRLGIILTAGICSQWVGNGVVAFYTIAILETVGVNQSSYQLLFKAGLKTWGWFSSVAGSLVCEHFGRRKMWLTSAIGQLIAYAVITGCSALYTQGNDRAGPAVLTFIFVYLSFFALAFSGLTLAYPIEILPYSMRSKGVSILLSASLFANCLNVYITPIALHTIEWRFYFVFIGVLTVTIPIIYFYFPETKGHMLEEIAEIFDGERPCRGGGASERKSSLARRKGVGVNFERTRYASTTVASLGYRNTLAELPMGAHAD